MVLNVASCQRLADAGAEGEQDYQICVKAGQMAAAAGKRRCVLCVKLLHTSESARHIESRRSLGSSFWELTYHGTFFKIRVLVLQT